VLRTIVLSVFLLGIGGALASVLVVLRTEPPLRDVSTLPILVDTLVVTAQDVPDQFIGYGTAGPMRIASLAAEVSSNVIERVGNIRSGTPVATDQVLFHLDPREYNLALERALARSQAQVAALDELAVEEENLRILIKTAEQELRIARDERTRVMGLFEQGQAAKKEYDFANLAYQQSRRVLQAYEREVQKITPRRANLEAAKRGYDAEAGLAQLNVERCEIRAPWAGQIDTVLVDVGDRVGPGTALLTLIDASRVEIPIELPSAAYHRVHPGAPCRVMSESLAVAVWTGEVARVAPGADERTRTFAAYVMVDNTQQPKPLVPGTFARAEIGGPIYHDALMIPRSAYRNGVVFIADDGIARKRVVRPERYLKERMIVSGELRDADRLILSHLDRLIDGTPVRVGPNPVPSLQKHAADAQSGENGRNMPRSSP
jgi:multidrug resistance efflux pump